MSKPSLFFIMFLMSPFGLFCQEKLKALDSTALNKSENSMFDKDYEKDFKLTPYLYNAGTDSEFIAITITTDAKKLILKDLSFTVWELEEYAPDKNSVQTYSKLKIKNGEKILSIRIYTKTTNKILLNPVTYDVKKKKQPTYYSDDFF